MSVFDGEICTYCAEYWRSLHLAFHKIGNYQWRKTSVSHWKKVSVICWSNIIFLAGIFRWESMAMHGTLGKYMTLKNINVRRISVFGEGKKTNIFLQLRILSSVSSWRSVLLWSRAMKRLVIKARKLFFLSLSACENCWICRVVVLR